MPKKFKKMLRYACVIPYKEASTIFHALNSYFTALKWGTIIIISDWGEVCEEDSQVILP